jgi:hypothetical protein
MPSYYDMRVLSYAERPRHRHWQKRKEQEKCPRHWKAGIRDYETSREILLAGLELPISVAEKNVGRGILRFGCGLDQRQAAK